ncbi:RNA polymerase sigma factor [Fibrella aquatilis]|uniref:RNA polymerase subunit sigma n=1 Tax=Fibrella aquatilis TaxID=2817059 RepID=A0A939JX71_9BACT|nr:DUF6596 domain-containing protein [Fibrella aquatilis]MBO0932647.1 RNA polymerase subunit sigma [Fibrella aquatilis]
MENAQESLRQVFQQEFTRMVAVISRRFGLQHIELAEDIVGETFLLAAETWGVRGLPANPTAWLYTVAKQKAIYQFRRRKLLDDKVIPGLMAQHTQDDEWDTLSFSAHSIRDSQLQMLFAICNPLIADEAQIGLALRILCGFGIYEIAEAFLTNKETINKRLFRAKEKLRAAGVTMDLPADSELVRRLDTVLRVIYLLFNEGYYSSTQNQSLQKDVCLEAMRLGVMLTDYEQINSPKTNALLALMCFHASRFEARHGGAKSLPLLYEQQNDTLWDTALIRQGFAYLDRAMQGNDLSTYHLEARIASWHCIRDDTPEKWTAILSLYNQLVLLNKSPSAALNQVYALYKVAGQAAALAAAKQLRLDNSHLYFTLLGELYRETDPAQATASFQRAYSLAKTQTDRQTIQQKLDGMA